MPRAGPDCGRLPTSSARRCSTSWARAWPARGCSTPVRERVRWASRRSAVAPHTSRSSIGTGALSISSPRTWLDAPCWMVTRLCSADLGSEIHRIGPAANFDLIFLDPPYDTDTVVLAARGPRLAGRRRPADRRYARRAGAPGAAVEGLQRTREVTSGDSALGFYAKNLVLPGRMIRGVNPGARRPDGEGAKSELIGHQ